MKKTSLFSQSGPKREPVQSKSIRGSSTPRAAKAFSLVEVLIAMVVLTMCALSAAALTIQMRKSTERMLYEQQIAWTLHNITEQIRGIEYGPIRNVWATPSLGVELWLTNLAGNSSLKREILTVAKKDGTTIGSYYETNVEVNTKDGTVLKLPIRLTLSLSNYRTLGEIENGIDVLIECKWQLPWSKSNEWLTEQSAVFLPNTY